jgi:mannose-6-phosphate isomerase-like protein (cupin superfamily)
VRGRGRVTVGDDVRDVIPGPLVFVAAKVPHRFHDIVERLELLVVFGPAEGDRG